MPLVTVVIPTFNRADLLPRAVHSVLDQTMRDLEVIVVIDGDDPATLAALAAIDDPRLSHRVNAEKMGAGRARDAGARAGSGTWVAFLDDDDAWLPEKLERQLALADGKPAVLNTLTHVISPFGELVRPARPYAGDQPLDEWLFGRHSWLRGGEVFLQTSALMFPRVLFDTIGFGTARHEEWELCIRATKEHGLPMLTVPEPLVLHYISDVRPSLSKAYSWERSVEWADGVGPLLSRRAYSGFCLTSVPQAVSTPGRSRAMMTLLGSGLRRGKPTARQLFAFAFIWLVPHDLRRRIRARGGASAA